ncbi:30S ribosomal protein S6 [Candidatus Uhrbacteria bacterium]|nr:30S ribosomal protein S6 [Candidatus Uhrbacteria bacterium]
MNHYEILAIASGRFADTEINGVIGKIEELLKKYECALHYTQNLERRKLAYPIKHQAYGTYVFAEFDCSVSKMSALDRELRLTPELLRHMIVKRDTVGVPRPLFKDVIIEERRAPRRQQKEKTLEQALETVEKETAAARSSAVVSQTDVAGAADKSKKTPRDTGSVQDKIVAPLSDESNNEKKQTEKIAKIDEDLEKELDKKLEEILREGV